MSATVDLHLHTTASDGRLSPTDLVRLTANAGLEQIAISDHDTTEGLTEAFQEAEAHAGLRIIPAIELSTDIPGDEIHMLGYFIRHQDEAFQEVLRRFRLGRLDRARLMVEKLAGLGMQLEWERVQEIAGDGAVGRPHIALAMVEKGYCKEPNDAFPEYLGRDGLAYVERPKLTPTEAIELLRNAGGAPVLAHPAYLSNLEAHLPGLKAAGLAGMEVHYAKFTPEQVEYLGRLAAEYDLIPCGGSDYHGLGNADDALPGSNGPPPATVDRLEEAAKAIASSNRS